MTSSAEKVPSYVALHVLDANRGAQILKTPCSFCMHQWRLMMKECPSWVEEHVHDFKRSLTMTSSVCSHTDEFFVDLAAEIHEIALTSRDSCPHIEELISALPKHFSVDRLDADFYVRLFAEQNLPCSIDLLLQLSKVGARVRLACADLLRAIIPLAPIAVILQAQHFYPHFLAIFSTETPLARSWIADFIRNLYGIEPEGEFLVALSATIETLSMNMLDISFLVDFLKIATDAPRIGQVFEPLLEPFLKHFGRFLANAILELTMESDRARFLEILKNALPLTRRNDSVLKSLLFVAKRFLPGERLDSTFGEGLVCQAMLDEIAHQSPCQIYLVWAKEGLLSGQHVLDLWRRIMNKIEEEHLFFELIDIVKELRDPSISMELIDIIEYMKEMPNMLKFFVPLFLSSLLDFDPTVTIPPIDIDWFVPHLLRLKNSRFLITADLVRGLKTCHLDQLWRLFKLSVEANRDLKTFDELVVDEVHEIIPSIHPSKSFLSFMQTVRGRFCDLFYKPELDLQADLLDCCCLSDFSNEEVHSLVVELVHSYVFWKEDVTFLPSYFLNSIQRGMIPQASRLCHFVREFCFTFDEDCPFCRHADQLVMISWEYIEPLRFFLPQGAQKWSRNQLLASLGPYLPETSWLYHFSDQGRTISLERIQEGNPPYHSIMVVQDRPTMNALFSFLTDPVLAEEALKLLNKMPSDPSMVQESAGSPKNFIKQLTSFNVDRSGFQYALRVLIWRYLSPNYAATYQRLIPDIRSNVIIPSGILDDRWDDPLAVFSLCQILPPEDASAFLLRQLEFHVFEPSFLLILRYLKIKVTHKLIQALFHLLAETELTGSVFNGIIRFLITNLDVDFLLRSLNTLQQDQQFRCCVAIVSRKPLDPLVVRIH
jgi:hypothetical protein